ncbi:hypothetical protein L1987_84789 [Smallanthus sonchifolius]|uniref:Uncharacterized protein n=1 Tax=Smallanthus sonchifolius TaxID=185202 RepID=A0ACB8XUQ6_9ASTR|nr:hypothetical protein L1987_84789 [Smallanthus sonchifolius]
MVGCDGGGETTGVVRLPDLHSLEFPFTISETETSKSAFVWVLYAILFLGLFLEMEIFEAKMMKDETLSGNDDDRILKPEETVGSCGHAQSFHFERTARIGQDGDQLQLQTPNLSLNGSGFS